MMSSHSMHSPKGTSQNVSSLCLRPFGWTPGKCLGGTRSANRNLSYTQAALNFGCWKVCTSQLHVLLKPARSNTACTSLLYIIAFVAQLGSTHVVFNSRIKFHNFGLWEHVLRTYRAVQTWILPAIYKYHSFIYHMHQISIVANRT